MKTNYNSLMEEIIKSLDYKPKLLLHACCGICSSSVLERLSKDFNITVLFFNPNIYPVEEYKKRYDTLKKLINLKHNDIKLIDIGYKPEMFDEISKGLEDEREGGKRCTKCYYLRLEESAKYASENDFEFFCTTLSVSPHKDSERLNNIGKTLESKYRVKYLYSDFKKKNGFKRSNELSRELDLYRQKYCGCKYSIW
ncbi:MAG: epoxyqueuosine reductase QueH [Bacilli bacterium]|nr:epoxyqueuosine reductase QueH [Bacilli bacterium]